MYKKIGIAICVLFLQNEICVAQVKETTKTEDSSHIKYLQDITIVGRNSKTDYQQMPEIVGVNIYAGKKISAGKLK